MAETAYLRNAHFFSSEIDGALTFNLSERYHSVADVQVKEGIVVIETNMTDPGLVLEPVPEFGATWKKSEFAKLGHTDTPLHLVQQAQERFGLSIDDIRARKRTIGAMTTLAFVFDDGSVKIAVVQRTSKGPDGTPNMGALSRFGGGVRGGTHGEGVHGAQHLGCQTVRELLEEFHPYVRNPEGRVLTPLDIIPQGYELNGLKSTFMAAAMQSRLELAARIDSTLSIQPNEYVIGERQTITAFPITVPGLTRPLIQIIDGHEIMHENVVAFDAQLSNRNLDYNTDMLFAVRVQGVSAQDFILKDGETDQKTNALLDRIIFFGDPKDLKQSAEGIIIKLHEMSDMSKSAVFSPAFVPILRQSDKITAHALECVF